MFVGTLTKQTGMAPQSNDCSVFVDTPGSGLRSGHGGMGTQEAQPRGGAGGGCWGVSPHKTQSALQTQERL